MIDEDDSTTRLLRLADPRPVVPPDRASRVRGAVHEEWQGTIRRRTMRRRAVMALVMIVAAGTAAAVALRPRGVAQAPVEVVAHVERVDGAFHLGPDAPVRSNEWIQTGSAARVALRLRDGTSMRLDSQSRMRMVSAVAIELTGGAVYIDSAHDSAGLEVRTALGTARDIGTQFETRVTGDSLRVRVRTGVVELRRDRADPVTARAGTELTLKGNEITTRPVHRDGPEWVWAAALAPPFDIEGRTVAAFVEHVSRERGWSLRYADAALARDASSIILHGSVAGLEAEEALAAALATSDLVHRVRDGELLVSRRGPEDP